MPPFFSRKPNDSPLPEAPVAPSAPVLTYDAALVPALLREHKDMLLLLDKAKGSVQAGRYEDVKDLLAQLRDELSRHIRRETDELHAYLTAHIRSQDRLAVLKDMHAGILRTERALEGFLKHYAGYPVTDRNAAMFYKEIDGVSAEFSRWMQQEEQAVYPLYAPPESY